MLKYIIIIMIDTALVKAALYFSGLFQNFLSSLPFPVFQHCYEIILSELSFF